MDKYQDHLFFFIFYFSFKIMCAWSDAWLLIPLCLQVIRSYASNRTWVIGFLVDIFGALLMLRALSLAPVSPMWWRKKIDTKFEGLFGTLSSSVLLRLLTMLWWFSYVKYIIGLCHPTGFWLWTSNSINLFPFLSQGSHECCWLGWHHIGRFWHNR